MGTSEMRAPYKLPLTIISVANSIPVQRCSSRPRYSAAPVADVAALRNGGSYLRLANAMLGDRTGVTAYDRRVFLGYPALIAGLGALHVPISLAALVLN